MKMLNKTKSSVFLTTAATFFSLLCVADDTFYLMPHWAPYANKLGTSSLAGVDLLSVLYPSPTRLLKQPCTEKS